MSLCTASGIGGLSNSAKSVPSKSVEISLIGKDIVLAAAMTRLRQHIIVD